MALNGLFIIAFFYTLYFARALILPFILALLLNFLLRPVVRALRKVKMPELAGAALVLIALIGTAGYGVIKLSYRRVPRKIASKKVTFKPLNLILPDLSTPLSSFCRNRSRRNRYFSKDWKEMGIKRRISFHSYL